MEGSTERLALGGIEIAFRAVGARHSPTVVLLHGWASSLRMWSGVQEHLLDRYRTLALDLPGHGFSSKPPWSWYSIPNYVDVVQRFLDALQLDRVAAIGHSMGGTIALELAARDGGRVTSVVAVNPVVTGRVYSRMFPVRDAWVEPAVRVSRRVWPSASRLLVRPPEAVRRHTPEHILRNSQDLGMTTADSVLGSMRAVLTWDLSDSLRAIRSRTLIIVGEDDRVVSPEEGEIAAREIPGAGLIRLEAAHHPNDEIPEAFYPHLDAFLTQGAAN